MSGLNMRFSSVLGVVMAAGLGCTQVSEQGSQPGDATDASPDEPVCEEACAGGATCCGGSCSTDPTCGLSLHSLDRYEGFVGGGRYVNLEGTGFSTGMKVFIGDGRAPVRVIDSQHALMLTPPAVEGSYDVRVEVADHSATLPESFSYYRYGFTDEWVQVNLSSPRGNYPGMATLQDGRLLIEGGTSAGSWDTALNTAEVYDPNTQTTSPTANLMSVPRFTTAATTLLDGRVLIVGVCNVAPEGNGCGYQAQRGVAEVFDPSTSSFSTLTAPLADPSRRYFNTVLLTDGRVLIQSSSNKTAEIFDPTTNTFSLLPLQSSLSKLGLPARLRDGRVAFVSEEGVEIFDPDTGSLSLVTPAALPITFQRVATMPDGRVLAPGGSYVEGSDYIPSSNIYVFDPQVGTIGLLSQSLGSPRMGSATALLRDGTLLVAGGETGARPTNAWCNGPFDFSSSSTTEVVDPVAGTVASFTELPDPNMGLVATTLLDGSIIVGGGSSCNEPGAYPYIYYLESVATPID